MSITWRAAVAGLEAISATCAVLNLAYFVCRMFVGAPEQLSRRAAAFVLALVSLGALVESLFVLGTVLMWGDDIATPAAWAFARALSVAATACVSALVLRALGR